MGKNGDIMELLIQDINTSNGKRCHMRKTDERTINKDVENMGFMIE